jgi:hypothetical protein
MSRSAVDQLKSSAMTLDEASIDRLYGLEPVFDPAKGEVHGELGIFVELPCPWCGEIYGSMLDLTDASRAYIEDCQVCCSPIEVSLEVNEEGALASLTTRPAQ